MARTLLLVGAGGMVLSALLPWITIEGLGLDLGVIGATAGVGSDTVAGTDTSIWPLLVGAGVLVAVLAVLNVARKLLAALGLLVVVAGAGLLYYVANAVELEGAGRGAIEQIVAQTVVSSSTGPGTPVLLASGIAILAGALLAR
jgi:hypothetical protein